VAEPGSLAGILARIAGPVWKRVRGPRLQLSYDQRDDALISGDGSGEHLHLRLRVTNGGWETADESRVRLADVEQVEGDRHDPIPTRELKWADIDATLIDLEPRSHRLVDLVATERDSDRLLIAVIGGDPTDRHTVPTGTYTLSLVASARNARPQRYRVVLRFDGQAAGDLRDRISLSLAPGA